MSTSSLAVGLAGVATVGLVIGLGVLSLLIGAVDFLFGKPRLSILKTQQGKRGLAFAFRWNEAKEPARFDTLSLKLYNPFGNPSQVELTQSFNPETESFAKDLELGPAFDKMINAKGLKDALVQIEIASSKDGVVHHYEMKGEKFLKQMNNAKKTVEDLAPKAKSQEAGPASTQFGVVPRDNIADTVPGKGDQLMLPTNPTYAAHFQAGSGGGGEAAPAQENFSVAKVWIIDGCIVCNACEDIYPEVFKVLADGCIVLDGYPTDDGLKVEEASDACPVEVIKYEKA